MSRSLRRRLLVLAGLPAAALAALALGWFPQGPLRRRVERELQSALGPDARVGGLRVVPWRLGAEAWNLVVVGDGYRLEIPRLELTFDAGLLVGGPLSMASLDLDSPRLELQPAGRTAATPAPTRVPLVRNLSLRGGSLVYEDRAALTLRLSGLSARGSLGQGALEIEATGGALEGKGAIPIRSLRAKIELSPLLELRLHSLETLVGRSRLSASGSLGRPGAWLPDVRVDARLDLAEAAALAATRHLGGDLGIEGHIRGAGSDLWLEALLKSEEVSVEGWPLRGLRGRVEHAAMGAGRTTLSLRADLFGGRLEAEGQRDGTLARGALQVAKVGLEGLRRGAGLAGPPLAGALSGRLDAKGDLSTSLQVRGRVEGEHAQPELSLSAAAEVSGQLRVSDSTLDLTWTATLAGRGAPGAALGPFAATAEGTARGPFPPAIEGRLAGDLRLATPGGLTDAALDGAFQAKGDSGEADLRARVFDGTLTAKARARGSHIESLTLAGESLSLAAPLPAASGRASFHIDASGPVDRLTLAGRAAIDELAWEGAKLGPLSAALDGPQSRLRWTLAAPAVNLTGSGELGAGPRRLTGSLRLESTPLSPFAPLLTPDLTGLLVGSVDLDIPLSRGDAPQLRARLEAGEAARGPWSARLARPVALTLRGSRIEMDGLRLEGDAGHIEASGRLGTGASDPIELRLAGALDLARVPWPAGWTVAGRTTADVALSGTIAEPEARGQVLIRELSASGPSLPPLSVGSAAIELGGREATLSELTAEIADGRVTLSASLPLALLSGNRTPSGKLARARLTWTGVAARDLIERLRPGTDTGLDASLAGQLEIEAPTLTLPAVRGRLELPSTAIRVEDVAATLEPLSVRLLEGRLQTEGLTLETPGGRLTAAGSVDLLERRLDIEGHGALALRALSPLLGSGSLSGTAEIDLTLTGPFAAARPDGQLRVRDGSVRLRDIPQALTDIAATLVFEGDRLRIDDGSAVFGGGAMTLAGTSGLVGTTLSDVRLTLAGRDIALRYPPGLKSRVDTDLTLTGRSGSLLLSGTVKANRGLYDLDIAFSESFRAVAARAPESPLLRSIALDIRIETPNPVRVKNNLADLQASGYLTLRGDLQEPAPFGRLEVLNGGKVFLQGRAFAIESGQLEYAGSWDPSLNVTARALIRGTAEWEIGNEYKVDILVQGTLERPAIHFSSDPSLSEPEIVSLIATGRTGDEALRSSGWVAGEQAAILLAGSLTRGVSDRLRGLGLDEVTIQPELLAREADPGARFTFGKQLGPALRLVYSLSLSNPEDRFVQVEARPGLAATGTLQRRDDGTLTYGLGQRLELGGAPRRRDDAKEERTRLRELRFEADAALPEAVLREQLELRPGDRVTVWQVQERAERLREKLRELGHLEADVGARLDADTAVFRVRAGTRYTWRVEGMPGPPDLTRELHQALFEEEALELGRERLLGVLHGRGHLRADVEALSVDDDGARTLVFTARPGAVYSSVEVRFPGAHALPESRLRDAAGGPAAWLMTPSDALQRVRQAYTDHHYLAAEIGAPQVEEEAARLIVTVPVREGPPARIAAVLFEGASRPAAELAAIAGIRVGAAYDPAVASRAVQKLRDDYLAKGYPGVRVVGSARAEGTDVVAAFAVAEGPQVSVGAIEIVGATRTRESLVRRQVTLESGDPLDPRKLAEIERRLLALGVFSRAVIIASPDNPATLRIEVEERARLRGGYDVRYNDDEKTTLQLDAELANLFGRALALGSRLRVGRDVREARGSLFIPALAAGDVVGSVFQREEDFPGFDDVTGLPLEQTRVERGFQLQQTLRLPNRWNLLYGYRFKRSFNRPNPVPFNLAGVDASLVRDTRDSPLDARRGRFLSANVEYSPSLLASDFTFIKGLAQVFVTRSLNPSLVWAQGYRLGLAHGFGGQRLVSSERFLAGGPNTVRGYPSESLGPRNVFGEPAGGQALVVLNQELRYRYRWGLGAAVFYDAGNVFETVGDFRFDLRSALGVGVRWESPVGLLRLDLGFSVGRKSGEKAYQLSLGLGQAF